MNTSAEHFMMPAADVRFRRNQEGRVVLERDGGATPVSSIVAAFPLTHRQRMISVRDSEGAEIGILDDIRRLDPNSRTVVDHELERTYFMPRVTDVLDIEEDLNVVEWDVETDKGPRRFQVRSVRKNVRRFGRRRVVIKDVDGNRYEIRDWTALPRLSQTLVEPYLWR
ncbi:MAG: DUF1854 domain-containing protein [Planctomycetota bacterium]